MDKKHIGSNFDDFLSEEGLLEQAEAVHELVERGEVIGRAALQVA